jgi:hypothetical protein
MVPVQMFKCYWSLDLPVSRSITVLRKPTDTARIIAGHDYARVSTNDQDLTAQRNALLALGL